jgi:cell division septation protein DedD
VRYRHAWPGFLLLAALALLLAALLRWGDHFLSPGPTGGIHRLLQLWATSRPPDESAAAPHVPTAPSPAPEAPPAETPASPPTALASPEPAASPPPPPSSPAASPAPAAPGPVPERPAPTVEPAEQPRAAPPATPPGRPSAAAPTPIRYALALGTFAVSEDAERVEAKLNQAGFSTVRFRQQAPAKLFAVQISSLKDPEEGQATVERLQKEGYPQGVLLVGRTGVSVRVGPPAPLRTAVQLAEKLRAAGHDARVLTEPTRAGQISLRHGNFASRPEAEAASREISGLGVPNEVIQIR